MKSQILKTNSFPVYIFIALSLLLPAEAGSQHLVSHGVFSNGGGIRSGSNITFDTVGQALASDSCGGGTYVIISGFWYPSATSSTVDVAITSFSGECKNDAVTLRWEIRETANLEGFNIYRSEGAEGELERINEGLIPRTSDRGNEYTDESVLPAHIYKYQLGAVESGGIEWRSYTVEISLPPKPLTLYQNYPNPFNPSTSINFYLPEPQHVTISIYDTQGKRIRTLVDEKKDTGKHAVFWQGKNEHGNAIASGVYFYRLTAGKKVITRKLVILR